MRSARLHALTQLENSRSAVVGAIEIYEKPTFTHGEEVFVILVLDAWELLLKAILSKNRRSIFYRRRCGEPHRTLSWSYALKQGTTKLVWPKVVGARLIEANLEHLTIYDAAESASTTHRTSV